VLERSRHSWTHASEQNVRLRPVTSTLHQRQSPRPFGPTLTGSTREVYDAGTTAVAGIGIVESMHRTLSIVLALALALTAAFPLFAREETTAPASNYDPELAKKLGADERGMRMYVFCILKTGPKDGEVKGDDRKQVFKGHFENIERLASEGKLVVAGPFGKNDKSYRGLYIFNVTTIEEAEKLVNLDPAVAAGVFVPDLTLWYGSAGMMVVTETHRKVAKPAAK
jgi:uncharacterized protein YciI